MSSDEENGKGENEFFVEQILDKRFVGKKVEYLIKWKGLSKFFLNILISNNFQVMKIQLIIHGSQLKIV